MNTQTWLPYVWGALGGFGVLAAFYGLRRVTDKSLPESHRKAGLWLVNAGVIAVGASLALAIWVK
ncbi:MAG: hypothetical protein JNM29_08475 [Candidatus Odyssella sp.]|nr:hypothetical protein [Candidatus Odyssella sp.]